MHIIVTTSCVGSARMTVTMAIDLQPKVWRAITCSLRTYTSLIPCNDGREHIVQTRSQSELPTHTQLNHFYLTSIPGITCMTSHIPGPPVFSEQHLKTGSSLGMRLLIKVIKVIGTNLRFLKLISVPAWLTQSVVVGLSSPLCSLWCGFGTFWWQHLYSLRCSLKCFHFSVFFVSSDNVRSQ